MTEHVTVGCFYRSLPMMAAQEHGFFARYDVEVDFQQVTSSIQQFEYLRDGRYDVVQTSPDNTANYRFNRHNPIGDLVDGVGFLGLDYGMYLVLTARPGIERLEDLRGGVISVDAPDSGFAYVAYRLLQQAGLERGRDYDIAMHGGVFDRFQAFMQDPRPFDATLLCGGFETRAERAGFHLLDSVLDIADPYLGVWATARRAWLDDERDAAVGFTRGYLDGLAWMFDPTNREDAVGLLMRAPNTDRDLAEQLFELQTEPGVGNIPAGAIDADGVRNVLELRASFGGFEDDIDIDTICRADGDLYDLSVLELARTSRPEPETISQAFPGASGG